jgi:endonuclease YncB( thermonuclease family)
MALAWLFFAVFWFAVFLSVDRSAIEANAAVPNPVPSPVASPVLRGATVAQPVVPWPICVGGFRQERRVTCVVDGDTFYIDGRSVRLSCIDTPEVTASTIIGAARAEVATRYLQRILGLPDLMLVFEGRDDRFGRALGSIDIISPTGVRAPFEAAFVATTLARWVDYPDSRAFCAARGAPEREE